MSELMSLGWFLPRSPSTWQVAEWVGGTLRLPLLRGYGDAWLFWAGGTVVFEPKSDASPERRYTDPDSSPALPVFRTSNLEALLARLADVGVQAQARREAYRGREAVIADPFGHLLCFRQPLPDSDFAPDAAARQSGNGFNPGVPPMPGDLAGLDWIRRHVADLAGMTEFYQAALGAAPLARGDHLALFDLGDGTVLELAPGGHMEPVPADRFEVPDAFILRVADFDAFKERLLSAGAVVVNDRIQFGRGALGYVADPEGHLIGYEARYDQANCPDDVYAFAEDLEANRRWRSRQQGETP